VNRFALPELVLHGRTGWLLQAPATVDVLAGAIEELIRDHSRYLEMRQAARRHALENYQWDGIGNRMASIIQSHFGAPAIHE
jgi:glycosyltransferase involved in cell wall biosynthesis